MSTLSAMTITNHMMTEIFSDPYLGITRVNIHPFARSNER